MKDCIYREAAKDAAWNDIINNVVGDQGMYGYLVNLVDRVFDNIPAADVQSIVFCKDCAVPHNKWTGCPKLGGLVTEPDFFCGFGEPNKTQI